MNYVKGGSFSRGEVPEIYPSQVPHTIFRKELEQQISVMDFYLDPCPVSNTEFVQYLNLRRTVRSGRAAVLIHLEVPDCHVFRRGLKFYVEPGFEDFPVTYVTWYGADAYARWLGKRLPTDTEWEFAANRGNPEKPTTTFQPVNSGAPDANGFYHLFGNVWEWCADFYSFLDWYRIKPENPATLMTTDQKILKGGAWNSPADDFRSEIRGFCDPRLSADNIGFRCAKSL
jgi:formylglycine-generating enzyme required for sulfatase activity